MARRLGQTTRFDYWDGYVLFVPSFNGFPISGSPFCARQDNFIYAP